MDEVNEEEGCYYTMGHLVWRDAASESEPAGFPAQVSLETGCIQFLLLKLHKNLCIIKKRCQ